MKPFNLERASAGDPVGTRDGESKAVHIFHAYKAKPTHRVIAVLDNGFVKAYHEDGLLFTGKQFPFDLVMLPKIKTYWYAIFRHKGDTGTYYGATFLFENKEDLLKSIDGNKIIRILSIDIEEKD